jgi:hypothetical protein
MHYVLRHGKRIAVEIMPTPGAPPARRKLKQRPFKAQWIQVPRWWLEVLQDASASAHQLALIILAEAFKRQYVRGGVMLSSEVTKMPHSTRRRAAKELIRLGLIVVEWNGKRAGTVSTINFNKKRLVRGAGNNGEHD